ncbi:histidinol-phosphate transaminase [Panacagrimonas sp.]|uniref:histidinol-phosphate transaminase n=1 Tax=Panacagrimonas sp. TaxID=2480088 RepID=UPI003B519398
MTAPNPPFDFDPLTRNALPGVLRIQAYTPGMPIDELQRRLGLADVVKLASNENPLGASPRVQQTLANAAHSDNLALYPDGSGFRLKRKIGEYHGIAPERVTLGNGSNDLLEFLSRIYAGPGRAVMYSDFAFAVYALAAQAQNADSVVVPAYPADHPMAYGHDLEAFAHGLRQRPDVSLVFIANPNNPTGTWNAPQEILGFLEQVPPHVIVALDEAYWDYQDPALRPDARPWLERFPNLVITRTFSKIYGIASLRVGYALSHPTVADLLNRVRQPFNNNSFALLAAEAALDDQDHVRHSIALNTQQRASLETRLRERRLTVLPSQANFLTVGFGRDARDIHQGLLERGVIVRPMGSYGLPEFLRVTVGTAEQNERFLDALDPARSA